MAPGIGITTYHREGAERPRFTLPTAYVDAVRSSGGLPLLLATAHNAVAALLLLSVINLNHAVTLYKEGVTA